MRAAGHRLLPHTADLMIESWAPTKVACLEEAARALVESFAATGDVVSTEPLAISLDRDGDEALLVSLIEEMIFVIDTLGRVPVQITLEEAEDGGVAGSFDIAEADAVQIHGSIPKGVSFTDLAFAPEDGSWRCRVTVDV